MEIETSLRLKSHSCQLTLSNVQVSDSHGISSQMLKRSPADGRGANPPVTSGSLDTSGKFSICDFTSALTA